MFLGVFVTGQQIVMAKYGAQTERMHGKVVMWNQRRGNGRSRISIEVKNGVHSAFIVHQILRPRTVAWQQVDQIVLLQAFAGIAIATERYVLGLQRYRRLNDQVVVQTLDVTQFQTDFREQIDAGRGACLREGRRFKSNSFFSDFLRLDAILTV